MCVLLLFLIVRISGVLCNCFILLMFMLISGFLVVMVSLVVLLMML